MKRISFLVILIVIVSTGGSALGMDGFTQKDRELLITLKVKVEEIDKRFEQIDKRFEQVDKRFDQMMTFLWMIVGIFTTLTASTIVFALWDRRSMIRPFESKIKELEEGKIEKVISALRYLAETDSKVAEVLRRFHLL